MPTILQHIHPLQNPPALPPHNIRIIKRDHKLTTKHRTQYSIIAASQKFGTANDRVRDTTKRPMKYET